MPGVKLNFKVHDFARRNNMGTASFQLKNGNSVHIVRGLDTKVTHLWEMKGDNLLSAYAAKNECAIMKQLLKYNDCVASFESILNAVRKSFMKID